MANDIEIDGRFSDDEPIDHPSKDELDFARIAERFADAIIHATPQKSFVIAVNGGWGTGKSSFANLVIHFLGGRTETPIVIRYNPWLFQSPEQLTKAFFLTLLFGIRPITKKRRAVNRAVIDMLGLVIGTVSATQINPLQRIAGGEPSFELDKLRQQIVNILEEHHRRILVVIDDIDRLTSAEITKLFALIKTVGNLPYVTYLLSFDKDIVIRSLSVTNGVRGHDYLEKIVQFSFDLPLPDDTRLAALLIRTINENCQLELTRDDFSRESAPDLLGHGIIQYIDTMRNLYRLTNVVTFTWSLVKDRVRAVDFVALETLRVFEPEAFRIIREYRDHFVDCPPGEVCPEDDDLRVFHGEWMDALELDERMSNALGSILGFLFPRFSESTREKKSDQTGSEAGEFGRDSQESRLSRNDVLTYVLSMPLE